MGEAGLLFTTLQGYVDKADHHLLLQGIDNLRYPLSEFAAEVLRGGKNLPEFEKKLRLFLVVGNYQLLEGLNQKWRHRIDQLKRPGQSERYQAIIDAQIEKYKAYPCSELLWWLYLKDLLCQRKIRCSQSRMLRMDDLALMVYFGIGDGPGCEEPGDFADQMLKLWLDWERPQVKGYQCLTRSFIIRNLIGRRIIGYCSDHPVGRWNLRLEGGLTLAIPESGLETSKIPFQLGGWASADSEEITRNPLYAYGYRFTHLDLFLEWQYVFFYGLTVLNWNDDLPLGKIDAIYLDFLQFMADNICPCKRVEPLMPDKTIFLRAVQRHLHDLRRYLTGDEESGIAKNIIYLMKNRYGFLPPIYEILERHLSPPTLTGQAPPVFDSVRWRELLKGFSPALFTKGFLFDAVVGYFFQWLGGLRLTGRQQSEEGAMTLYGCNYSLDPVFWKMGPLILLECKERALKIALSEVRNLLPVMDAKGLHTVLIFSPAGFSREAIKEINQENRKGKMMIPVVVDDLQKLSPEFPPDELLKNKILQIKKERLNNDDLIY